MNAMKSMEGHTVKYLHSDSQSWMSLPELPIEYFSRRILTRIIGKGLFSLKGALHYGGFSHKSSRLKTLWSLRPQSLCLRVEAAW